jgi:hypothetical protein
MVTPPNNSLNFPESVAIKYRDRSQKINFLLTEDLRTDYVRKRYVCVCSSSGET